MDPIANTTDIKRLIQQIIISLLFVFFSPSLLWGQERVIQGMVTTYDSLPLINANIEVKSTKEVVLTDTLGMFTVKCLAKDKLNVTAMGFIRRNVKIKENTKYVLVNLKLMPKPESRELAIGYGHVKDADKLYAISNVNENDLDFSKYSNIYDIIAEMFSSSAQVRSDGEIVIRGTPTMDGNNAALLILDGREIDAFDFGNISPSDIANINVLKDASASVYGSRGGNGVVIVETKRGGDR
jgi:TonB-dependent SusC/RagA subfamily outer membrane receptor